MNGTVASAKIFSIPVSLPLLYINSSNSIQSSILSLWFKYSYNVALLFFLNLVAGLNVFLTLNRSWNPHFLLFNTSIILCLQINSWCSNCILPSSGCLDVLLVLPGWVAMSEGLFLWMKPHYLTLISHICSVPTHYLMNTFMQKYQLMIIYFLIKFKYIISHNGAERLQHIVESVFSDGVSCPCWDTEIYHCQH